MDGSGRSVERPGPGWGGFSLWVLVGAAVGLAALSFPALGLLILVLVSVFAAAKPGLGRSALGALAGAGAVCVYVAYVQRRGPGTVCWHTATASGCDQYLNPWPWLVVGLALVLAAFIAQIRQVRRARGRLPGEPSRSLR